MKYEPLKSEQYYHIYNRGNNREDIFLEEKNYYYFLNLMKKYIVSIADVLAYCLLKNHFHLLIRTRQVDDESLISKKFSDFFNAYAKAINKQYNRSGSLFQDRFSRKIVKDEIQLRNLITYIHTNPTHHGFEVDFANYKYSSYNSLLSNQETLLDREFVLNQFGDRENYKYVHRTKSCEIDESFSLE
jgi:REP element-mobilizing transposase RayT